MLRAGRVVMVVFLLGVRPCCAKEAAAAAPPQAKAAAAKAAAPAAVAVETNMVSIGAGGVVAQKPAEEGDAYGAFRLIDEVSDRGWSTPDGVVSRQAMVFSLPGKCQISRVEFDTEGLKEGRAAKDVVVEISDTSATAGFTKLLQAVIKENANHQSFPASNAGTGRWIRLTVQNNHGAKDNIELLEFRAFGKQLVAPALANVSGEYTTNSGDMQLRQDGASVAGCYGTDGGKINGGVDGRTMKFNWREASGDAGTAVVSFSDDGKDFFGLYWHDGDSGGGVVWTGSRATEKIAGCGLTSNSAREQMVKDIESGGRTRVYGILFDTDSAKIKPESKAALDDIVAVLKSHAGWSMTVEGHTDSTGGAAHNEQLSQQRAESVKSYLVNAGISAARLTTKGYGASKPVAPNDTEIGRAQNRRVELSKR